MSRYFESIRIEKRQWCNIKFHNLRMNLTRNEVFGKDDVLYIEQLVKIPDKLDDAVYKCRITYTDDIENVEFDLYTPRIINTLKLVEDPTIDYRLKSTDRSFIQKLYDKRGTADDIIIVQNGFITDSSYTSLIFFDGNEWFTSDTPLLISTHRLFLLDTGKIKETEIKVDDLKKYSCLKMVNAMMPFDVAPEIPIENIIY